MVPIDPAILQQLTQRVEQCGVAAADARISYVNDFQSDVIYVTAKKLDDPQIECLDIAGFKHPTAIVIFADEELSTRSRELARERAQIAARERLAKQGKLDHLPAFDPQRDDLSKFARRVESFCGFEPGSVLEVNADLGIVTYKMSDIQQAIQSGGFTIPSSDPSQNEKFTCLSDALLVSADMEMGFIGNEAYRPEN